MPDPSTEAMIAARRVHSIDPGSVAVPCEDDDCSQLRQIAAALEAFAADHCGAYVKYDKLEAERDALRARNEKLVAKINLWHAAGHAGANHPGHRDTCEVGMCGLYREALAADAKAGDVHG